MEGIPIPPIPMRTRHADSSKRHTINAPDSSRPLTAKSYRSNRVTLQPASTEVISSLISSLSAISTPAEDLFDKLLPPSSATAAPPSPTANSHHDASLSRHSTPVHDQGLDILHPEDAALPPVIRTSKPPSGYSPLTAPSKRTSFAGFSPTPSKSSPNLKEQAVLRSIGNLSIEPGPRSSSDRISIISNGSKGSRGSKDPRDKSSKEKIREIDRERKKKDRASHRESAYSPAKTKHSQERSEQPTFSPRTSSMRAGAAGISRLNFTEGGPSSPLKRSFSDGPSANMSSSSSSSVFPIQPPFLNESALAPSEGGPGGIGSGRIPTRESSLRHTPATGRSKNRKSYRATHIPKEIHVEHPSEYSAIEAPQKSPADEVEQQVRKRIDELKSMKEKRERAQSDDDERGFPSGDRRITKGRSSLPAPSSPEPIGKPLGKKRRGSDPSQTRPERPISPPPEHEVKHLRSPSNTMRSPRNSSATTRDERPSTSDSIDEAVVDYLTAARLSNKIYHPHTGRAISFSDVGDPDGSVVFCCLGMGTTRFLTAFYDELAATLKLRLVTLDRPGIGESEPYRNGPESPLAWPDDIRAVCSHLRISRFSILAHSAGAIYALATALRMPQHIRGRIHLLAPWIPPSQMIAIGLNAGPAPVTSLPMSQRFLRSLPTPFLKAANSTFFSMTSTSITTSIQRSPRRTSTKPRRSFGADTNDPTSPIKRPQRRPGPIDTSAMPQDAGPGILTPDSDREGALGASMAAATFDMEDDHERQLEYEARLTQAIWSAATTNANPAVDLLVCLERMQEIGFRYVDVRKEVVIYHGDQDTRVPLGNVRWLGDMMRSTEVRVLEGEGHGLMANPVVMGDVLSEMAQDWDDWLAVTGGRRRRAQM